VTVLNSLVSKQPSTISQHYFICTSGRSELNSSSSCMLLQILCLNSQDTAALVYIVIVGCPSPYVYSIFLLLSTPIKRQPWLIFVSYLLFTIVRYCFLPFLLSSGCIVFHLLSIQKIMHFFFNLQTLKIKDWHLPC
jgi:hypothetical protein